MTKQELAEIALKILGIYALLTSIQFIGSFISVFNFPSDGPWIRSLMLISVIAPLLLLLWAGYYLLCRTSRISLKYFPEGQIQNINIDAKNLQSIAFSIIGVVLIVTTIPKLSQLGVSIYALSERAKDIGTDYKLERDTIAFGISILCKFILGILLFISGDSITNLWMKIVNRIKYETNIT